MKKTVIMKKTIVAAVSLAATLACASDGGAMSNGLSKVERLRRATGGFVFDRRQAVGQVVFVNAQRAVPFAVVSNHVAKVEKTCMMTMKAVDRSSFHLDEAQSLMAELSANVAVFLCEHGESPFTMTVMPEQKFAIVNVKALAKDSPDADTLARRLQKELSRAVAFVFGAGYSVIGGDIGMVKPVVSLDGLDNVPLSALPADTVNAIQTFAVNNLGFKLFRRTVYITALKEGWAQPPKGEYQRALWDKVHAMPSKPMKIEFDPKKGR